MRSKCELDKVEILIWDYDIKQYVPVRISRIKKDVDALQVSSDFQIQVNGILVFENRNGVWRRDK